MPATSSGPRATFAATFAGTTETLNVARQRVVRWLEAQGEPVDSDAVLLVVSELISNAIQTSPNEQYEVRVDLSETALRVQVRNRTSDTLPARSSWESNVQLAPRGRGLGIIEVVGDSVESDLADGVLTVTVSFEICA